MAVQLSCSQRGCGRAGLRAGCWRAYWPDAEGVPAIRRRSWGICLQALFLRKTRKRYIQTNKCVRLWNRVASPCRSIRSQV